MKLTFPYFCSITLLGIAISAAHVRNLAYRRLSGV